MIFRTYRVLGRIVLIKLGVGANDAVRGKEVVKAWMHIGWFKYDEHSRVTLIILPFLSITIGLNK